MRSGLIWFTPERYSTMIRHVVNDLPNEACGVLLGHIWDSDIIQVQQIVPINNTATEPKITYRMDDVQLARVVGGLEKAKLSLVGFYHSHPTGDFIPSSTDVKLAAYPDIPFLIVGLNKQEPLSAAWLIHSGEVHRISIMISDTMPPSPIPPMSEVQKSAILITTLLTFVFVIVLALLLLPPAPEIPR